MNRLMAMIISALVGCILGGCGSPKIRVVSDNPHETNHVNYKVVLERNVSVACGKRVSAADGQRQTETSA
jgi:hypothetical protein